MSPMSTASTALPITGLDGETVDVSRQAIETLRSRLDGPVLLASDAGFQGAIQIWNAMVSRRPALVVQPASTGDVREAVTFARANSLLLSIKGGGHNIAGSSLVDGGVTLDVSRMRTVEVDPERRLARVGPGCLLGDVDRATQPHGLATALGTISETGVAGLTLGGGFGYLTRRFGWTVDNLEEVEIVTADGQVRRAAEDEHEDLFWALRGGGGNYGVVTRFTFKLHEVGPEVTGGLIVWGGEMVDDVVALYKDLTATAPRELTLWLIMRPAPPAAFIPAPWHGKPVVGIIACHIGDHPQAARDLAPLRTLGKPIADLIGRKRFVEQQSLLDDSLPDGMHQYMKSEFLPRLSDELLETLRAHASHVRSPMSQLWLFQLGGALADRAAHSTACGNRDAAHIFIAVGTWFKGDPAAMAHRAWVRSAWEASRVYSSGNYVNVHTGDEDDDRMRAAYGDNFDRLARIKAAYDPDNLFRINRNIPPATTDAVRQR